MRAKKEAATHLRAAVCAFMRKPLGKETNRFLRSGDLRVL